MKKEPCLEHGDKNLVKEQCPNCERSYSLYCFLTEMEKGKERDEWIQALKRENLNRTNWIPKSRYRIGSLYFVDGIPTKTNPLSTMHIDYNRKRQKTRRPLFKYPLPVKKIRVVELEIEIGIINNEINRTESTTKLSSSVVLDGHFYC